MKLLRTVTASLLALSMSFAAVSAELKQGMVVVHAEEPDPELLREYAEIIVSQVNDLRMAYTDPANPSKQIPELAILPVMCDYAQVRAKELPLNFDHKRPLYDENGELIMSNIALDKDGNLAKNDDGSWVPKNCFTVIKEDGFWYGQAAENIAAGNVNPVPTFEQWLNSKDHRANMLGENFTHIGIGYYYVPDSQYKYYWSMFLVSVWSDDNPKVYEDQFYPPRVLGDVDGSHVIDATDASKILQYSCEKNAGLPARVSTGFLEAADVNGDGIVNSIDASIILSYTAAAGSDPDATLEDFIWG